MLPPPPGPALCCPSHGARGCRSWSWHRAGWSCHRQPARPAGQSPRGTAWPGRLQRKGQGRDAGFAEMRQGHQSPTFTLCSPEASELLPSLSWIHSSLPLEERLSPVHCPVRQWLAGTQAGLCPFLGEEAGLDGPTDPHGQSCRVCPEPFPAHLFLPNFLQFS